ncbi:Metallo-dependent phosphatase-like protein [Russula dissimulans]|nr:Metallo-dependent phosphatase-like protein [Russula dissimulans]
MDRKVLCDHVRATPMEESNTQPVSNPVTICGDICGQFWDLLELLRDGGTVLETSYIFVARTWHPRHVSLRFPFSFRVQGDFVDRGHYCLETVQLDKISDLRGNHESRQITQVYGFYEEWQQKYGSASVWKACCNVLPHLNQICVLSRAEEIPHEGAFCDLMWSDPDDIENWWWLFGSATKEFNHVNSLSLIARAHQLVQEGYKYIFDEALATVWSAPNYCYHCGNMAAILTVRENGARSFTVYDPAEDRERDAAQWQIRRAQSLNGKTARVIWVFLLSKSLLGQQR